MLQSSESETEILLGNKQLLGVFFVVVVLLGVAFAGGYKIGQSAGRKALVSAAPATPEEPPAASAPSSSAPAGGETHAFPANGVNSEQPETPKSSAPERSTASDTGAYHPPAGEDAAPPLGSASKRAKVTKPVVAPAAPTGGSVSYTNFTPVSGQTFLQVAAVGRDEAQAIADVLHKKGFKAHAVPKPGGGKIYRVLIGPIRDTGDLSSTRDSLRKTGFREIFVQRY
ncbi:MAG: Sporulation domain protein [Bryobacterales bacterium]|jgi:cell division septation protein DedD|nr:Sporulation domain protein [Bryobacterales bacterium]